MAGLSDADVFGAPPAAAAAGGLSDAEVFGAPAPAAAPAVPVAAPPAWQVDTTNSPAAGPSPKPAEGSAPYVGGLAGQTLSGLPIAGAYMDKVQGAIDAAATGVARTLGVDKNDTYSQAPDFMTRMQENEAARKAQADSFAKENPAASTTARIAGGILGTAPLIAAAPAAFGVGGASLPVSMAAGATTGASLNAADALARGEDPTKAAMWGAGGGALGPLAGRAVGAVANKVVGASDVAIPTNEEIKAAASAGYEHPDVKALQIKPAAAASLSGDIQSTLLKNGADDIVAPQTTKIIERLATPRFGPSTTVEDLDGARKALGNVTPNEIRPAAIARAAIDDYMGNIPQTDLLAGDAQAANKILLEARANAAAGFRDAAVKKALSNADINTAASYSGGNIDNATRQQLKPILKNILNTYNPTTGMFRGWSPEEVTALRSAVLGNPVGNLMRGLGKMGPSGGLMGGLHIGAAIASGGSSLPISAVGLAAKAAGDAMTRRSAASLSNLIRSRAPASSAALLQNQLNNTTNAARSVQLQRMISNLGVSANPAKTLPQISPPSPVPTQ
jgi:hypothetical protein